MLLLVAAFILSFIGSLPPGFINLSVAQVSITKGIRAALLFASGAAFVEFFQACIALHLFASVPNFGQTFNWVALFVFLGLGTYLFFFAPPPSKPTPSIKVSAPTVFLKGALLSAINLLAIPYWFVYGGWLMQNGWWTADSLFYTLVFSFGVTLGTITGMWVYARLGRIILERAEQIASHVNRFIGLMFMALAVELLFRVFKH